MEIRTHYIEAEGLDPITVIVLPKGESASRIIVQCYTKAWTAYWGSHGECPVEYFIAFCDKEYLGGYLIQGARHGMTSQRAIELQEEYVNRIAQALIDYFKVKVDEEYNRSRIA